MHIIILEANLTRAVFNYPSNFIISVDQHTEIPFVGKILCLQSSRLD